MATQFALLVIVTCTSGLFLLPIQQVDLLGSSQSLLFWYILGTALWLAFRLLLELFGSLSKLKPQHLTLAKTATILLALCSAIPVFLDCTASRVLGVFSNVVLVFTAIMSQFKRFKATFETTPETERV